jgi:hypothetical protein
LDLREAQNALWGQAGAWAYDTWHQHNAALFSGELEYAGIVWGLTPHGALLGHTSPSGRVTLHPSLVDPSGERPWGWPAKRFTDRLASDVLAHELIHARLFALGAPRDESGGHHNRPEWAAEIVRLSPLLLGVEIRAEPVRPRRIDGKVTRRARRGFLPRAKIAGWPYSVRSASYYERGRRLCWETTS